jgi:hypothetical protein
MATDGRRFCAKASLGHADVQLKLRRRAFLGCIAATMAAIAIPVRAD